MRGYVEATVLQRNSSFKKTFHSEFEFYYQGLILLMRQDVNCVDSEGRLHFLQLNVTKIYGRYKVHVLARHRMFHPGPKRRRDPRIFAKTNICVYDVPQRPLMHIAWGCPHSK